ncbi:hypothetical protein [Alloyangia pacifica]|uniref:Uncharacterized protein n=1 Tax=Alloyangia pacifica TaxID=311180 RepID=A0A1I6SED4_9RHOB|nr:hypothetical protein [Alloyangia pacifica]SDG77267.1 hypothetical protein SAMN04488245_104312 [Alloyangia pacifica]SFS75336.1 hypothetical protein SAMN04488050_104312 [Alloyangia pacifica]
MTNATHIRLTAANDNDGHQTIPVAITGLVHLLARAEALTALRAPANEDAAPAQQGNNA